MFKWMCLAVAVVSAAVVTAYAAAATNEMATPRLSLFATGIAQTVTPTPGSQPAAGREQPTPASEAIDATYMPVIDAFACEPCEIDPGETASLRWEVRGAKWVTLDDRGVEAPGAVQVQPDQTTTYLLIAANENGRSEKRVTVQVRGLPVIHYFSCEPCEIRAGEMTRLSWDLSGGTAAYLDGEGVTAPGSAEFMPDRTTTYRLDAVGESGSVERLVTVTVAEGADPDDVARALTELGYQVHSVGSYALASGGTSTAVVMAPVCEAPADCTQATAVQFLQGLKALSDSFPAANLTAAVYDGQRYTTFVTMPTVALQAYVQGELDGGALWLAGWWNIWDEWNGRWLPRGGLPFGDQDFTRLRFVH